MPRESWSPDADCGIAHALGVVGDWWTLLIVRDVARGYDRFDALATELRISRRVLTERLAHLQERGVVTREPYQQAPVRYRYRLTDRGRALLPVLVTLQDWGDRWVLGDGELTGTADDDEPQAHRVRELIGTRIPDGLRLPASHDGRTEPADLLAGDRPTVVFAYPGTSRPSPMPDGWYDIAGTAGCTLENRLFRDRYPDFVDAGVAVRGLSGQRPDEQRVFAAAEAVPFPLLSDEALTVAAALRLPVFRAADAVRIKRLILVVAPDRTITAARFPITDIPEAVDWSLTEARRFRSSSSGYAEVSADLRRV